MENKNKFTPGPWKYHVESHCIIEAGRKPGYSDYVAVLPETSNEAYNSALISAAPSMYSALEAIAAQLEQGVDPLQVAQQARAAIKGL